MYMKDTDIARRYKIGKSTVWRWVQEGLLPQPIRLSPRCTRWNLDDIEAWEEKLKDQDLEI